MKLTLIAHPPALQSTSMPRFANMIGEGMKQRGHIVEYWTSPSIMGKLPLKPSALKKWLVYIDQYLIFPPILKRRLPKQADDTLFVVADQALGMWIPYIAHRPHVVHCHDFLALRSALGEIPQNPTSWTGQKYQSLIRQGFQKGKNFISVSHHSQRDLHRFLDTQPDTSEVVHNGLNGPFRQIDNSEATELLQKVSSLDEGGYILHVGGNQWYKNRDGVVAIYREYCQLVETPLPLWLVGAPPSTAVADAVLTVPDNGRVRFFVGLSDSEVIAAYNLAEVLLFPSHEEGFGWPIAEAMACGTRVITTNGAPMTEVGGAAATYIPRQQDEINSWSCLCARTLASLLAEPESKRETQIQAGLTQAMSFSNSVAMDRYESIYANILEPHL